MSEGAKNNQAADTAASSHGETGKQEKAAEQVVKPSGPGETGTTPGTNWDDKTGSRD